MIGVKIARRGLRLILSAGSKVQRVAPGPIRKGNGFVAKLKKLDTIVQYSVIFANVQTTTLGFMYLVLD